MPNVNIHFRELSVQFKVICFVFDPPATVMTKRKKVNAKTMSSYLGRVIALGTFGTQLNQTVIVLSLI